MNKKRIFLPWLGEFGGQLEYFLYIKAYKDYKIVCYEDGMDCLVPEADVRWKYSRFAEQLRKTSGSKHQYEFLPKIIGQFGDGYEYYSGPRYDSKRLGVDIIYLKKSDPKLFFVPETKIFDFDCDVVLFPRKKTHVSGKNWDHWSNIVQSLRAQGIRCFASGTSDMSYALDCPCAWDYDNALESSIWAIKHSKLRVGPVTAGPLLSLLCGKPVWIVVHVTKEGANRCSPTGAAPARMELFNRFDWLKVGWRKLPYMDCFNGWRKVVVEIVRELKGL